jgi:MFS family permease
MLWDSPLLSGAVTSFLQRAAARVGLGLGEAATGPVGQSMTSDLFSSARRTAALSLLAVATPVGFMLAFVLGGGLNQAIGWRWTLVALGSAFPDLTGGGRVLLIQLDHILHDGPNPLNALLTGLSRRA